IASAPAVKYKASAALETQVRTPLLTELAPTSIVSDLVLTPRLDAILYTNRLEWKLVYEPKLQVRQAAVNPTLEVLQSVYTRADYRLLRQLSLIGVHTTTYGSFPFDQPGGNPPLGVLTRESTRYIYSETAAGLSTTLGLRRFYMYGTLGWVVNGLLSEPPARPLRRGDAAMPQQRYPELRFQAFYGFARRDTLSFSVLGRDVSFSTGNRAATLQLAPGLEHQFSPLVKLLVEPGLALGQASSLRPGVAPERLLLPTLEATLKAPVPLGNHRPVQGRLRARYLPYADPLSTRLVPRGDVGLQLEWKGRRQALVKGELTYAHPLTTGLHQHDAELRASTEVLWPLPVSRHLFLQARGQLTWMRHEVVSFTPLVQWFTSLGLVLRHDRGRL
ncbi:MAG TPA: hypothetical protein VLQ93_16615, partial [Myxococcaceae bacterium]|nr:hypothetical protein [Myxococcaceae bacterium]